jgi:nitrite reductase (NADH) small subunit/3-phenylpropionate/trans-cinnamate dioxygenase ferredoxin subunit
MAEFVPVARIAELKPGVGRAVEVKSRLLALFLIDDRVHAIDDTCPHMGGPLSEGGLTGTVVMCPWHAWRFDVCDGTWVDTNKPNGVGCYETKIENGDVLIHVNW